MCQELKTEIFVNSIGFLHEESQDPFICRQDLGLTNHGYWSHVTLRLLLNFESKH